MKSFSFAIATAAAGAIIASAAPASAQGVPDIWGSAVYLTSRNCNGVAAGANCMSEANPDIHIVQSARDGGANLGSNASMVFTNGGSSQASVTYGALDLPVIKAASQAGADNRNNANSYGYQSFVYTGDATTPFALTATLDYTSSASPVITGTGQDATPYETDGEGNVFVRLGLMLPSAITGLTTAEDIINYGFGAECGGAGILGTTKYRYSTATGGASGGSLTLDTACDGSALTLTPGQQVLVFLLEQTPSTRGGYVDASHTLTLALADTLTPEEQSNLTENLVSARSAVPEPASWALMILGFGAIGLTLRGQRRARVV